mmetsp:Transcript_38583/g.50571  ORF Transcript_38583/g.50571 Transcript_38583/m.50571 type:complete len:90 (+) Transcript_38583:151-420(+)
MLKYVLKVATLDENLIVKQKARFLTHVLEYKEAIEVGNLTQAEPLALDSSDLGPSSPTEAATILPLGKKAKKAIAKAPKDQIEEAERIR